MGLLTILKKMRQKEQEMRILLLGLDNAGKTTLVRSLTGESVDTVAPTLGFSIVSMQHGSYTLNLWDVGGQKSLRSYWRNYFEATDGVIWVVDSADILRLSDCRDELHSLLKDERLLGATLLVLANKQDLPGAVDEAQVAKELQLHSGCIDSSHHWKVMAASARTGSNVVEGVQWMVDDIASRVFTMD